MKIGFSRTIRSDRRPFMGPHTSLDVLAHIRVYLFIIVCICTKIEFVYSFRAVKTISPGTLTAVMLLQTKTNHPSSFTFLCLLPYLPSTLSLPMMIILALSAAEGIN